MSFTKAGRPRMCEGNNGIQRTKTCSSFASRGPSAATCHSCAPGKHRLRNRRDSQRATKSRPNVTPGGRLQFVDDRGQLQPINQMLSLLDAISIKAATLSATFTGGYHRDRAPGGTTPPYIVATMIATPSQAMYGATRRGEDHVRLAAIGIGHDATLTNFEALTAAFDDAILTLASGQNFDSQRLSDPIGTLFGQVDGDGNELWQWSAEYRFSVRN